MSTKNEETKEEEKECKHRWVRWAYGANSIHEECPKCRDRRERKPTAKERKLIIQMFKEDMSYSRARETHGCWWSFSRLFMSDDNNRNRGWRYTGYDLMTRVEKWAKRWPDKATILGCDDDSFMSSYIVMIKSFSKHRGWMGIHMVTIPQNGDTPSVVFLYPSHALGLMNYLKESKKQFNMKEKPSKAKIEFEKCRVLKEGVEVKVIERNEL